MAGLVPTCDVPKEYESLLRERGFRRETPEVKVSKWRTLFSSVIPTPVIFRSQKMDLKFQWERIVEASAGPPHAGENQWLALEVLVPLATGKSIYEASRPLLPDSYYASALAEHFDKIAAAIAPEQFEASRKAVQIAADAHFKGVSVKG